MLSCFHPSSSRADLIILSFFGFLNFFILHGVICISVEISLRFSSFFHIIYLIGSVSFKAYSDCITCFPVIFTVQKQFSWISEITISLSYFLLYANFLWWKSGKPDRRMYSNLFNDENFPKKNCWKEEKVFQKQRNYHIFYLRVFDNAPWLIWFELERNMKQSFPFFNHFTHIDEISFAFHIIVWFLPFFCIGLEDMIFEINSLLVNVLQEKARQTHFMCFNYQLRTVTYFDMKKYHYLSAVQTMQIDCSMNGTCLYCCVMLVCTRNSLVYPGGNWEYCIHFLSTKNIHVLTSQYLPLEKSLYLRFLSAMGMTGRKGSWMWRAEI